MKNKAELPGKKFTLEFKEPYYPTPNDILEDKLKTTPAPAINWIKKSFRIKTVIQSIKKIFL